MPSRLDLALWVFSSVAACAFSSRGTRFHRTVSLSQMHLKIWAILILTNKEIVWDNASKTLITQWQPTAISDQDRIQTGYFHDIGNPKLCYILTRQSHSTYTTCEKVMWLLLSVCPALVLGAQSHACSWKWCWAPWHLMMATWHNFVGAGGQAMLIWRCSGQWEAVILKGKRVHISLPILGAILVLILITLDMSSIWMIHIQEYLKK